MASMFRVLETRRPRSSGSRPSPSVSARVVQRPANEADLEGDFFTFRAVVGGGSATASRTPPFGSPSVTFLLPVLTHDVGIIISFATLSGRGAKGLSEHRMQTREDRGH